MQRTIKKKYVHPVVSIGKWVSDKFIALIGLIVTLLLLPGIALAIRLDSKGPIFFRQLRVGRAHAHFTELFYIWKFRTMCVNAEVQGQPVWASKNDPRITRVGSFLRLSRLDELPQLWNVLCGDMSMVGPRPERPGFFAKLENQIPFYAERVYDVAPGITGWAQVYLGYDTTVEDVRKKVAYDHAYALALGRPLTWLITDFKIIWLTFKVMFLRRGR